MLSTTDTLLASSRALSTALRHRDVCWLNQHLTITAECHLSQARPQSKYDWIDALQNGDLSYRHLTTPVITRLLANVGEVQLTATSQLIDQPAQEVTLQLSWILADSQWQLYRQLELSEKPIDWIR